MRAWLRLWRMRIKRHRVATGVIVSVFVVVIALIIIAYRVEGTGFSGYRTETTATEVTQSSQKKVTTTFQDQPGKTLWDWLQLLIAPAAISLVGLWFTRTQQHLDQRLARRQHTSDQRLADQRAESERKAVEQRDRTEQEIALGNQREAALQGYFDKMSELLLKEHLRDSAEDAPVRQIARARTLTVLRQLDPPRKASLLRFLYEADLIFKDESDANRAKETATQLDNKPDTSRTQDSLKRKLFEYLHSLSASIVHTNNSTQQQSLPASPVRRDPILDLEGADLSEVDLSKIDLHKANLSKVNLHKANLSGANLREANLNEADLSEACLKDAKLKAATLRNAVLSNADLTSTELEQADLIEARLDRARLHFTNLKEAQLVSARLGLYIGDPGWERLEQAISGAVELSLDEIRHGRQMAVDLLRTDFQGANLRGAWLNFVDFSFTKLSKVESMAATNLNFADLSALSGERDLSKVDLELAELSFANLSNASLEGASLEGANLYRANLSNAKLRGARLGSRELNLESLHDKWCTNLTGTNMSKADLTDAELNEADLSAANLTGATYTEKQLSVVSSLKKTILCDGSIHP